MTDDRPFFFYTVQPRISGSSCCTPSARRRITRSTARFRCCSGWWPSASVATLVILALPPLLLGHSLPRGKGSVRALLFFLFIGAGYILIQVALIQKFVLFLGHPTYALTVIIFSMLISSGFGSFASKRLVHGGT